MKIHDTIRTVQNLHKGGEGLLVDKNGDLIYDDAWLHKDILSKETVDDPELEEFLPPNFRVSAPIDKAVNLAFVLDLHKAMLHKGRLVKKLVPVKGKNKTFYAHRWVDPTEEMPAGTTNSPGNESTYLHHEKDIKALEHKHSGRFPVIRMPVGDLFIPDKYYKKDDKAVRGAVEAYHRGEGLDPIRVYHNGEILRNEHLYELAKQLKLTHVPVIVFGNSNLKKQLEEKHKDEKFVEEETSSGEKIKMPVTLAGTSGELEDNEDLASLPVETVKGFELVRDEEQFRNFTVKRYTPEYLMKQAKNSGITWATMMKNGLPLAGNADQILWKNAFEAIVSHIKSGRPFMVKYDSKEIDKKMELSGKKGTHRYMLELMKKFNYKQDDVMEWCRKNNVHWKEKSDPDTNWMNCYMAIENKLAQGHTVAGIKMKDNAETRAIKEEANLVVTPQVQDMITAYGKKYGKTQVMAKMEEQGIEFDRFLKNGNLLENQNILWMRASTALAKHIAKGKHFSMGQTQDTGIKATVGDNGGVPLSKWQKYALEYAKRNTQEKETDHRAWAMAALKADRGLEGDAAQDYYNNFMTNARNVKVMYHFDPLEILPNGSTLAGQLLSDGRIQNDYFYDRGYDTEHKESNDMSMFGREYPDDIKNSEFPVYGVVDLYNHGLNSNAHGGSAAFVLKDEIKKRATGSHKSANNIGYGEDGKTVRSLEDPHHLMMDRWTDRWKKPNKKDAVRIRAMDSVSNGTPNLDDGNYFEAHVHGGVNLSTDVDHILVPSSWQSDSKFKKAHEGIQSIAKMHNIPIKYEESANNG